MRRPNAPEATATTSLWATRLAAVAAVLGRPAPLPGSVTPTMRALEEAIGRTIDVTDRSEVWLVIAAVSGQLPEDRTVTECSRAAELDGPSPVLEVIRAHTTPGLATRTVEIVTDTVLVDVHNTARTDLATGIQRVARETARRWATEPATRLVAWTEDFHAMRELTTVESDRMSANPSPRPARLVNDGTDAQTDDQDSAEAATARIIVPWRSTVLIPELVADRERNKRQLALARHTPNRTGAIGFDCIPVTSGETSDSRVADFFADHLATMRHVNRISTISRAAAAEYRGWRTMLQAIGMTGPEIEPTLLPAEVPPTSPADLDAARRRFVVADMPLVVCVGTHEPRKNHLAVLHAAEVLWREGISFSLTFIGGHSWRTDHFRRRMAELQDAGRPLESASGIEDSLLWGAYRLARCTVFPSLNEGYGLPAAESLAVGTPVITSRYGSMAEIAADGGALLVDPRDDGDVTSALRRLLTDDALHRELADAALARPARTWDDYARETWTSLVG